MELIFPFTKCILMVSLVLFVTPPTTETAKILFLTPILTRSETHFLEPIVNKLASVGHTLTVLTSVKASVLPPNVTELVLITAEELFGDYGNISLFENDHLLFFDNAPLATITDTLYTRPEFQKHVLNTKYDLIFTSLLFAPAFYGIIYKSQTPFILLNSFPVSNYLLQDIGLYASPAMITNPLMDYTDQMNFKERVKNFVIDWMTFGYNELQWIPNLEAVYKKHLGEDLPSVKEIQKNVSLVLMNTHFTSTYHRPIMPDVVEIGGIHCREAGPLPKELEEFVSPSAAPHGFIYISFGSVLKGSTMPESLRKNLFKVLSGLDQRVVMKWESEEMEGLPKNVILKKWLPQQDLLGHKNIKLFISHAGLLSTQQFIYHGVPALLFPVFFDQATNAKYAEQQGIGLKLDLFKVTEDELERSIRRILTENKFSNNAKLASDVFRSQINTPLERVAFWTDYVLKFNGAPHLRSSVRQLNTIQIHSIDVILFLVGGLLVVLGLSSYIIWKTCTLIFVAFEPKPKKETKKQKRT